MLADLTDRTPSAGCLGAGTLVPNLSRRRLIDFVAEELPRWRDHSDRPPVNSEAHLNAQLCSHLNGAARRFGLDAIQFCAEVPDDARRGRTLDLSIRSCGTSLRVEGRCYTEFETLLPIECKRLPIPDEEGRRGEREYVISNEGTTGGIQRFKLGMHGANHGIALLIGYIQAGTPAGWRSTLNQWLDELGASDVLWADEQLDAATSNTEVYRSASMHKRALGPGTDIELQHLWIDMRGEGQNELAEKPKPTRAKRAKKKAP